MRSILPLLLALAVVVALVLVVVAPSEAADPFGYIVEYRDGSIWYHASEETIWIGSPTWPPGTGFNLGIYPTRDAAKAAKAAAEANNPGWQFRVSAIY